MQTSKALAFFISLFFLPSCDSDSGSEATNDLTKRQTAPPKIQSHKADLNQTQIHTVDGTVISIVPNKKYIVIRHEEIPGFMNAMTMPFNVLDPQLVEGIDPEDKVTFTFEITDGNMILQEIEQQNPQE